MLQETTIGKQSSALRPPVVFSKSEVTSLGVIGDPSKEASATEEKTAKQADTKQAPVVFSKSETIPLGFTNKLLRKAAYGSGLTAFVLVGLSGISNKNPWRTASGLGSAAINVASMFLPERDDPLPDKSIPSQMAHAMIHPNENNLFFNRSATFITDVLKLAAGLNSGRKTEILEGVWKIGIKSVDIAGMSDQDRREKFAIKKADKGQNIKEDNRPLNKIFANRWVSLSNSFIAAGLQITQGVQHKDKKTTVAGILYFLAVSALFADNAIMESEIKKKNDSRGR